MDGKKDELYRIPGARAAVKYKNMLKRACSTYITINRPSHITEPRLRD